jgi:hypothetical protein
MERTHVDTLEWASGHARKGNDSITPSLSRPEAYLLPAYFHPPELS